MAKNANILTLKGAEWLPWPRVVDDVIKMVVQMGIRKLIIKFMSNIVYTTIQDALD